MIKKETLHPKNNVQDDIYPKTSTDQVEGLSDSLALKADKSTTYTKTEVDSALELKADKSTTYTKTEVDTALALKSDKSTTYTKTEVDSALALKQNSLVSGVNIKTINSNSLLGSGDILIPKTYCHNIWVDIRKGDGSTFECELMFTMLTSDSTAYTESSSIFNDEIQDRIILDVSHSSLVLSGKYIFCISRLNLSANHIEVSGMYSNGDGTITEFNEYSNLSVFSLYDTVTTI